MSLTSIIGSAASGLRTAQTAMNVVSDNIANVNTPGYVRKIVNQASQVTAGVGSGVDISSISRAVNSYLDGASRGATADSAKSDVLAQSLDNVQSLFGDPSGDNSYFTKLDSVFSAFSTASENPTSDLSRTQAISAMQDFLSSSQGIATSITQLSGTADNRIYADVDQVNDLLKQIDSLNNDIVRAKASGADTTASENSQSSLVDQLSSMMDVTVQSRPNGGINIRSSDGFQLAGAGAATLSYQPSSSGEGYVSLTLAGTTGQKTLKLASGEIAGLLQLRNRTLPDLNNELGEFVSKASEAINKASNAYTTVPAPTSVSGRDTGLDQATAVAGFTGKTTVAITNAAGVIQQRVDIDFDAKTMSVNGGAATAYSPASFVTSLTTALGAFGSASFSNGALSISATGTNGVAITDDATTPATRAGMGFSQFFGLNDLIQAKGVSTYDTGLAAGDSDGILSGSINFRITDASGTLMRDVINITPTPGDTMQNLLTQLNSTATGVGSYGSFALDANGQLAFTPTLGSGYNLSVTKDTTARANGDSMSQFFGIGAKERGSRGSSFAVNPTVVADPGRIGFAQLNLSAASGTAALAKGDSTGALALANAGEATLNFAASGAVSKMSASLSRYASVLGGSIANAAAQAASAKDSADSVKSEASSQRSSAEGVNIDEELISMTTYQQAYNASARLIQAAKEMYDTLLNMAN